MIPRKYIAIKFPEVCVSVTIQEKNSSSYLVYFKGETGVFKNQHKETSFQLFVTGTVQILFFWFSVSCSL